MMTYLPQIGGYRNKLLEGQVETDSLEVDVFISILNKKV